MPHTRVRRGRTDWFDDDGNYLGFTPPNLPSDEALASLGLVADVEAEGGVRPLDVSSPAAGDASGAAGRDASSKVSRPTRARTTRATVKKVGNNGTKRGS